MAFPVLPLGPTCSGAPAHSAAGKGACPLPVLGPLSGVVSGQSWRAAGSGLPDRWAVSLSARVLESVLSGCEHCSQATVVVPTSHLSLLRDGLQALMLVPQSMKDEQVDAWGPPFDPFSLEQRVQR